MMSMQVWTSLSTDVPAGCSMSSNGAGAVASNGKVVVELTGEVSEWGSQQALSNLRHGVLR